MHATTKPPNLTKLPRRSAAAVSLADWPLLIESPRLRRLRHQRVILSMLDSSSRVSKVLLFWPCSGTRSQVSLHDVSLIHVRGPCQDALVWQSCDGSVKAWGWIIQLDLPASVTLTSFSLSLSRLGLPAVATITTVAATTRRMEGNAFNKKYDVSVQRRTQGLEKYH